MEDYLKNTQTSHKSFSATAEAFILSYRIYNRFDHGTLYDHSFLHCRVSLKVTSANKLLRTGYAYFCSSNDALAKVEIKCK